MGLWDVVKRVGVGIATGGGSEVYNAAKAGYNYLYGDPAKEQKQGYEDYGTSAAKLGSDQRQWEQTQGQKALNFYGGNYDKNYAADEKKWLADPSHGDAAVDPYYGRNTYGAVDALNDQRDNRPQQQQQYFDYMKGQAGGLTNQEQLYSERKGGNDPAAIYEDQRATQQINNQLASRGRFNSGPGVRQVSDYLANANAQRSHQLAELAGGADSSRLGLDNAYGSAASGASGEESDYFSGLSKGYADVNKAQADTFGHYSDRGGDAYMSGQLAKYEADLAAKGVDAATRKQMVDDFGKAIGAAGKVAGAAG